MFLVAALMACTTTFAQSQNENGQARKAVDKTQLVKMRTEAMVKQLGLNEAQAEKLLALNTEYADKLPGMRGNRGQGGERPSSEEMQKKMQESKAAMVAYNTKLKTILTEEQMAKYTEMQKSRAQRGGNRQGGTRGQGGNRTDK